MVVVVVVAVPKPSGIAAAETPPGVAGVLAPEYDILFTGGAEAVGLSNNVFAVLVPPKVAICTSGV